MLRHFLFLPILIQKYAEFLSGRAPLYLVAVQAIITHVETLKMSGRVLPTGKLQVLVDTYHAAMAERLNVAMLYHLVNIRTHVRKIVRFPMALAGGWLPVARFLTKNAPASACQQTPFFLLG